MKPTGHQGLWIPKSIQHSDLKPIEKLVLAEIVVMSIGGRTFCKTNATLSKEYKVSEKTIVRSMRALVMRELIESRIVAYSSNGSKKRVIVPDFEKIDKL